MAHPFFESSTYPWDRADARAFHVELYRTFTSFNSIDTILKSCGSDLAPFAEGRADDMWKEVLEILASAQRLRLLGERLQAYAKPAVHKTFETLANAVDPVVEPGIASDRIFVDRVKLRDALGRLAPSSAASQVLLVRGEPASGKTWTKHIVEEQARALGQGCTYICSGLVATVDDTLALIFAELGGKAPKKKLSTEDASYQKACADMIVLAQKRGRGSWIVADDLGEGPQGPALDPDIRRLFNQIAFSMVNPAFARWFRLVLIDYPDGPLPTKWKGFWLEDRTAASDVQVEAVSEYLVLWALRKKKKVLAADQASQLAVDILAKADASEAGETRPRLERIHDEVNVVLGSL